MRIAMWPAGRGPGTAASHTPIAANVVSTATAIHSQRPRYPAKSETQAMTSATQVAARPAKAMNRSGVVILEVQDVTT
jgi:hypothetical protein